MKDRTTFCELRMRPTENRTPTWPLWRRRHPGL